MRSSLHDFDGSGGMLSAAQVSLTYGKGPAAARALDDVTVAFRPGEVAMVMGPSGSGKTTLLSVLGCLVTPDSGRVTIMDEPVSDLSEQRKGEIRRDKIGYVYQAFRLFRALSAVENVMLALELAGVPAREARERARAALQWVGLSDKGRLRPAELSGGEKQRVAIARALVNNAPIILADEPTASLDGHSMREVARMLLEVAGDRGRVVVVVSHDPRMLEFSHRVIELQDGRIVRDGPASVMGSTCRESQMASRQVERRSS